MPSTPAFQFYPDDFLSGVNDMSNEEVGAYMRLLCNQWTKGGLPNDHDRLSRMAGAMPVLSLGHVLAKFRLCDDGLLRNERLEAVRAEQDAFRERQSKKGQLGAQKRWHDGRGNGTGNARANACAIAGAMAGAWPDDSSPSPSPSPHIREEKVASAKTPRLPAVKLPADDAEWIKGLSESEAYRGIDVPQQVAKCKVWCETNRQTFSRRRVVNWLNRVEKPINGNASNVRTLPNGQTTTAMTAIQARLAEHEAFLNSQRA